MIRLSSRLKERLPTWYHPGTEHHQTNSRTAKCLIETHETITIADLIKTSRRLRTPQQPRPHTPSAWCNCTECIRDRLKHCKDPHKCASEAQNKINTLYPKYNPLTPDDEHGDLSLTASRKRKNVQAQYQNEFITFDPSITTKNDLTECFRIFANPNDASKHQAKRGLDPRANLRHPSISIYTDGACLDNGKTNAQCGSSIWFAPEDPRNKAIKVPGPAQSNQIGELVAVIEAIQNQPIFYLLKIHTDSKYVIDGLTSHLSDWDNIGWIAVQNVKFFQKVAYLLQRRSASTQFKWIKGHNGDPGNKGSDELTKEGANKALIDDLDLQIPMEFSTRGAKLSAMTQALAYKGIRQIKMERTPPVLPDLLLEIREAIRSFNGQHETNATIWRSFRKPILRTRVQQYFYKSVHQALMVGDVWNHIPTYEYRETCQTCDTMESMTHILTQCAARSNQIVWSLAKEAWPHRDNSWPPITIGLILGIGCLNSPRHENPQDQIDQQRINPRTRATAKGKTHLLQILISESAHLIWVLRCERTICGDNHTDAEIKARWLRKINERLTGNRITATKIIRNKTHKFDKTHLETTPPKIPRPAS